MKKLRMLLPLVLVAILAALAISAFNHGGNIGTALIIVLYTVAAPVVAYYSNVG